MQRYMLSMVWYMLQATNHQYHTYDIESRCMHLDLVWLKAAHGCPHHGI